MERRKNKKMPGRGGSRSGAGRPTGTSRFGEGTSVIRLPTSTTDILKSYVDKYSNLRRQILKTDLPEELAFKRLEDLDSFWVWLLKELSASETTVDIEGYRECFSTLLKPRVKSYRKYSSVAATPETIGDTASSFEEIEINDHLVENPEKSYLLDVVGDSMIDCGIYDGTLLIVEEYYDTHTELRGGEILVVSLGSSLSTMVKIFHKENDQIFLLSANSKYAPIAIHEYDNLVIQGVVKKIINNAQHVPMSQRTQYMQNSSP